MGTEAPASEVRPQGEDWGWLRLHSLKGASAPQLPGKESGKKSGPAEEARDHCFGVREERGFRAPPKWAPDTGVSRGYQHGPQRWAWNAKAAAAATKKPVCKHRSLATPPLLGACAAHYCHGPVTQGHLPWENTGTPQAVATSFQPLPPHARHTFHTPPSPQPKWARAT